MAAISFGTSGLRGKVESFTDKTVYVYVQGFLEVLSEHYDFDMVYLAVDRRPSSPVIASACAMAISDFGLDCFYQGVVPTPALANYSISSSAPCLMVTGSHIPFDRNGIKFYSPKGEITKQQEEWILAAVEHVCLKGDVLGESAQLSEVSDAYDFYFNRYASLFPGNLLKGKRIGVYQHSSAGRDLNVEILESLGADVNILGRSEEFVPVDTEAVSVDDAILARKWVEEYSLDALLTTDGDGDRPLIADETGTWWRGDILGLLCAKELGIETLAVPVSCNTAIEKSGFFSRVTRTKIGSPYVIEAMESLSTEFDEVAGFEANGGFLLGSDLTREGRTLSALPTRDALLPALTVMVAAAKQGLPLSAMLEGLPERYTASDRLKEFPTELSKRLIGEWSDRPQSLKAFLKLDSDIESVDVTDGLRVTLKSGDIIHLRPSGNAPELRCYAESDGYSKAESLVSSTLNKIAEVR